MFGLKKSYYAYIYKEFLKKNLINNYATRYLLKKTTKISSKYVSLFIYNTKEKIENRYSSYKKKKKDSKNFFVFWWKKNRYSSSDSRPFCHPWMLVMLRLAGERYVS